MNVRHRRTRARLLKIQVPPSMPNRASKTGSSKPIQQYPRWKQQLRSLPVPLLSPSPVPAPLLPAPLLLPLLPLPLLPAPLLTAPLLLPLLPLPLLLLPPALVARTHLRRSGLQRRAPPRGKRNHTCSHRCFEQLRVQGLAQMIVQPRCVLLRASHLRCPCAIACEPLRSIRPLIR